MWSSSELKAKGKAAMKANYGWVLAVSFILSFISGAGGAFSGSGGAKNFKDSFEYTDISPEAVIAIAVAVIGVLVIAMVFGFLIDIFLLNPLLVGCQNFFVRNTEKPAGLSDLMRSFKPDYKNNVFTMFLNDLFLFLWYMLFFFPGVVKTYSYRLVPYILADNPEMKGTEAITLSRKLMNGHKWKAFCFDLSFIGWFFLSIITCGIVAVFYALPYYHCSCAELYRAIRYESGMTEQ